MLSRRFFANIISKKRASWYKFCAFPLHTCWHVGTKQGSAVQAIRHEKKKDDSIFSMLESEKSRCERVVERLKSELEKLPNGSLGQRKVKSGGKEYVYLCIRFRKGDKVVFEHVSPKQADELCPMFERKKKLKKDLSINQVRLHTLKKLLEKR